MTTAHEDLHAPVDGLRPEQARDPHAVVLQGRRQLSFIGAMRSGIGDLAERHEEVLREG
ncbi:hypothetical protein [Microbispora hainanensis]|uniref:hypothetical protein n=1 Tax=Microbispora hainanensis TaxID=568844 RepID=UPI00142ED0E4|nr:hypothetical protein [Microbispora hainanensis]